MKRQHHTNETAASLERTPDQSPDPFITPTAPASQNRFNYETHKSVNKEYIIKGARLSFPELHEPKSVNGGDPRFGASFLLDKDEHKKQLAEIRGIVKEIADEEFDGKIPTGDRCALRDGSEKDYDGYENAMVVVAARAVKRKRPVVINAKKEQVAPDEDGYPYAGCYVNAKVNFYSLNGKKDKGHNAQHGKRICCEIQVVQFAKHGEPFGSGTPTVADMPDVEDDDDV